MKKNGIDRKRSAQINAAIVLAAGFGTRMYPYTKELPKPLIKVNGQPLIDYAINHLEHGGVKKVIVNLHYLGTQIERHLSARKGLDIFFSWETGIPLETGGGVKNALPILGEKPFWVVNSDSIWLNGPFDMMARMISIWDENQMDVLVLLHSTVESYGYNGVGDFILDPDGKARRPDENEVSPWLFTGIQIIHPRAFKGAPDGPFSLNKIYDSAISGGRLFGIVHDGEWFHIGCPDGYAKAEKYMRLPFSSVKRR